MSADDNKEAINKFFRGTQSCTDHEITGTFHISPIPKKSIPELKTGKIEIKITIPQGFPEAPPDAFIASEDLWIFPHTRMDNGRICPPSYARWSREKSLKAYLEYLNGWLSKVAENILELPTDYYELPQFPTDRKESPGYFIFTENNPASWLKSEKAKLGLFFYTVNKLVLKIESFDTKSGQSNDVCSGVYIWLPKGPIVKYKRPPIYFRELNQVLNNNDISISNIIDEVYSKRPNSSYAIIGFPVKDKNKDTPTDIHWQGFIFEIKEFYKIWRKVRGKNNKYKDSQKGKEKFIESINNQKILYVRSENCSSAYLYSRSSGVTNIRESVIFGCGAIGSHIAFQLARSGCNNLYLCDNDIVEPGNICRHIIDFESIGKSKAEELCNKLKKINPWGEYRGFHLNILSLGLESEQLKDFLSLDLWVDAGLPAEVSSYLSYMAAQHKKRMVSVYITQKAKFLIISSSGPSYNPSIEKIEAKMKQLISKSVSSDLKECLTMLENPSKDIGIRPNIGCYMLTFEAKGSNISSVAAITYDVIDAICKYRYKRGKILIYKFNDDTYLYEEILNEEIQ